MAQAGGPSAATKSIDVGGVFLMDLAVNDSEPAAPEPARFAPSPAPAQRNPHHFSTLSPHNMPLTANHQFLLNQQQQQQNRHQMHRTQAHRQEASKSIRLSPTYRQRPASSSRFDQRPGSPPAGSLFASVIDQPVAVGAQHQLQPEEPKSGSCSLSDESFAPSSGTSLSASLTGSSSACTESEPEELTGGGGGGGERQGSRDPEADKASTTTREDSGVLDMKDLEGKSDPYRRDRVPAGELVPRALEEAHECDQQQHFGQEKSISANIMATNLINSKQKKNNNDEPADGSANMNFQYQQQQSNSNNINYGKQQLQQQQQELQQRTLKQRSIKKPTDGKHIHHQFDTHHQNHHAHRGGQASANNHPAASTATTSGGSANSSQRRSVSASLPIQVPARQMKRNLNRMKLNLMREEELEQQRAQLHKQQARELSRLGQQQQQQPISNLNLTSHQLKDEAEAEGDHLLPVRRGDRNRPAPIEDIAALCSGQTGAADDDAFLEQEFNANHHNHYPIDELDNEHLTAEEDPMRLFASIQALAKSLHEDAELFGSLPPKRMLESPIRSLAFA